MWYAASLYLSVRGGGSSVVLGIGSSLETSQRELGVLSCFDPVKAPTRQQANESGRQQQSASPPPRPHSFPVEGSGLTGFLGAFLGPGLPLGAKPPPPPPPPRPKTHTLRLGLACLSEVVFAVHLYIDASKNAPLKQEGLHGGHLGGSRVWGLGFRV